MENNFFVGIVNHSKKVRRDAFCEKMILYKENSSCYVDLLNDIKNIETLGFRCF